MKNEGKRIFIGSDRAGFYLKENLKRHLADRGFDAEDIGTLDPEYQKLYYEVAEAAACRLKEAPESRAILLCGTGMGMAIAANKFPGIYAAVCESVYAAERAREINDANILTMGAQIVGNEMAFAMADTFLAKGFTEGLTKERSAYLRNAKAQLQQMEKRIMEQELEKGSRGKTQ